MDIIAIRSIAVGSIPESGCTSETDDGRHRRRRRRGGADGRGRANQRNSHHSHEEYIIEIKNIDRCFQRHLSIFGLVAFRIVLIRIIVELGFVVDKLTIEVWEISHFTGVVGDQKSCDIRDQIHKTFFGLYPVLGDR